MRNDADVQLRLLQQGFREGGVNPDIKGEPNSLAPSQTLYADPRSSSETGHRKLLWWTYADKPEVATKLILLGEKPVAVGLEFLFNGFMWTLQGLRGDGSRRMDHVLFQRFNASVPRRLLISESVAVTALAKDMAQVYLRGL